MPKDKHELQNLVLQEVSLVDRGANQKAKITFFKRSTEDEKMNEQIVKLIEALQADIKSLEGNISKAKEKNPDVDETVKQLRARVKELEDALEEANGKKNKMLKMDDLPKEARDLIEKQQADIKKSEERASKDAERIAKLEESNKRRDLVKKAETFKHIAKSTDELADLFFEVEKALPDAVQKKLYELLEGADKTMAKLFEEQGSDVGGDIEGGAYAKLVTKAAEIRKVEPKLTEQQAFAKAVEQNPELYADYEEEKRAGH